MIAPATADALATSTARAATSGCTGRVPGSVADAGPQRAPGDRLGDAEHAQRGPAQGGNAGQRAIGQPDQRSPPRRRRPGRRRTGRAAGGRHGAQRQVVAAAHAVLGARAERGQQVGDRAVAGQHGVRVDVEPRPQHGGPLRGAGVRQQQARGRSLVDPVDGDHVDVQRARPPAHLADPAGARPPAPARGAASPTRRVSGSSTTSTALRKSCCVDAAPRGGLVDRRRGDQRVGEARDGRAQVGEPVAEVGAERQHRARHAGMTDERPPGRAAGDDDGDVGEVERDRGARLVQRDLDAASPARR